MYIAAEVLPTTSWVELIDKRKFAKVALNKYSETFMGYIATLKVATIIQIHPSKAY